MSDPASQPDPLFRGRRVSWAVAVFAALLTAWLAAADQRGWRFLLPQRPDASEPTHASGHGPRAYLFHK
jgi:hypothetical protein